MGIGRQFSKKLKLIGVNDAYQFTKLSDSYVRENFSVVRLH